MKQKLTLSSDSFCFGGRFCLFPVHAVVVVVAVAAVVVVVDVVVKLTEFFPARRTMKMRR